MNLLQYRFLCYDPHSNGFTLLGYPLSLSPTETDVLCGILARYEQDSDTLLKQRNRPLSQGSLAVHVCSINRKAVQISGKKLLEYRGGAYRLTFPI